MVRSWGLWGREVEDGFFQDWDLETHGNGNTHTVEVKYDIRADETKNPCLELEALQHSKAEWLASVSSPGEWRMVNCKW